MENKRAGKEGPRKTINKRKTFSELNNKIVSLGYRWREICESCMHSGNCNTLSKRAIWHFLEDKPLHFMGILHYKGFLCPYHCRKVLERPWVWKGHVIREDGCLNSTLWDRWMMIKGLTICKLSELWHNSRRRRNYTNDRFRILCQFNWMETQKQHSWFAEVKTHHVSCTPDIVGRDLNLL